MIHSNELDREGYIRSKSLEEIKKNQYLVKDDKVKIPDSIDYFLITDEVTEIALENGLYAKKVLVGDTSLKTEKKTYLEAINELVDKTSEIDLSSYQTKTDNSLQTTSKEVVGAINEVNNSIKTIEIDANKITTGTIDLERLPAGALERLVEVENDEARFALTKEQIQLGDTVKVKQSQLMYRVINDDKLNSEEGYTVYTAGRASEVPWSGVTGKPERFKPEEHTHENYAEKTHTHSEYLSSKGGTVNGDLTVTTKITTPQIVLGGYIITVEA